MTSALLRQIDAKIRELTRKSPKARPFLCEGSPVGRHVFLVGINPGTDTPFWRYWSESEGFNKEAWQHEYLKRHSRFGPTRRRIEILCRELEGNYLEANVYAFASKRFTSLQKKHKNTELFEFLLDTLRPLIVFVHGKPARKEIERLLGKHLPLGKFSRAERNGLSFDIYPERHLSYHWTDDEVGRLGSKLRERLSAIKSRR